MKKILILIILALFLIITTLPVAAITNGEPDGEGHPNVGLMIADVDGIPAWRCSGTLIAPRVFLTAGHCVSGATGARVWFDSDLTDNTEYPYGGETSVEGTPVPHPDYLWEGNDPHDVGVVILDEAVDIEAATLANPDLLTHLKVDRTLGSGHEEGVYFRSVGYGRSLEEWPPPDLVSSRIRQVAESEYVALTQARLHLFQRAVFGESGSCFGDSGGPVFYDDEGNEFIVAVTSSGDAQCVATNLTYRVDVSEILDWIYNQFPD